MFSVILAWVRRTFLSGFCTVHVIPFDVDPVRLSGLV